MTINRNLDGTTLTLAVGGRLDTTTAPELEKEIMEGLDGVTDLVVDFEKLDYISSAGLRALILAYKVMKTKGSLKITNINEIVREIFDVTGFSQILTIE